MSKKGSQQPTISTYYVGLHFVLCHGPIDKITKIQVDEKDAWTGTTSGGTITINSPELFGGNSREGGIVGAVDIAMGGSSQVANTYLTNKLGAVPAFRGVVSAILNQVLIGTNYYLKPWAFLAQRIHIRKNGVPQWQDTYAEVGANSGLINAVHVIRDCLTDTTWGLGNAEAVINETDFLTAAITCYNEGLGFSFFWNAETSVNEFIVDVLKHIQGNLYFSRTDAQWHLKLTRQLSSTTGLVALTVSNVMEVTDFKRSNINKLTSSVVVNYTDLNEKKATVQLSDPALVQRQDTPVTKTLDYSGIVTSSVANLIAARDLQQLSTMVYSCSIKCTRDAENLYIGDAFTLTWPDYVPDTLTMRVVSINLGTPTSQSITIEAVQDVFSAPTTVYTAPQPSNWVSPISSPTAMTNRLVTELPYYLLATTQSDSFAQSVANTTSYIAVAGASPTSDSISAGIYTTSGTTFTRKGVLDFCFTGILASAIGKKDTTVLVASVLDIELLTTGHFIQIDNELLGVTAITSTSSTTATLTVTRGVLDSTPADHLVSTRMYGWHDFFDSDQVAYLIASETPKVKLTTITPKGELALASAPQDTLTLVGRMHKPYPPGNLLINSTSFPTSLQGSSTVQIDQYYDIVTLALDMKGVAGTTSIIDRALVPNTITAVGNAQLSSTQYKSGRTSLLLDGNGDYLTVPAATGLNLTTGDFCVEGWFYGAGASVAGQSLLDKDGIANVSYPQYNVAINASSFLTGFVGNGAGVSPSGLALVGSTAISVGTWHHFALTRSGSTVTLYLDGIVQATGAVPGLIAEGNKALYIGYSQGSASSAYFNGYIDGVRITKGSPRYTAAFPPNANFGLPRDTYYGKTTLLIGGHGVNNGATFTDSSYIGATLTTIGTIKTSTALSLFEGSATLCDGTIAYISVPDNAGYVVGTGDFTLEGWVYHTNAASTVNGYIGANSGGLSLYRNATGQLEFTTAYIAVVLTGTTVMAANTWYHVAVCRSGTSIKLFLNGALEASGTNSTNYTNSGLVVGSLRTNAYFMTGYLTDIRLTKGFARYTAAFTVPESLVVPADSSWDSVVLRLNFDGANGAVTTRDYSNLPKALTWTGNAAISTAQYKYGGSSCFFDGTGDYITVTDPASELIVGAGDFTVECWVYHSIAASTGDIDGYLCSVVNNGLAFYRNPAGKLEVALANIAATATGTTTLNPGVWYHVAASRVGTSLKLFVNGNLDATVTNSSNYSGGSFLVGSGATTTHYMNGYIDDLRLTKGVGRYTANFTPPSSLPIDVTASTSNISIPLSWANRNRIAQTTVANGLLSYFDPNNIAPTAGTPEATMTYKGTLKRTDTNATLASFTAQAATTGTTLNTYTFQNITYTGEVRVDVNSTTSNGDSIQSANHTFLIL